MAAVAEDVAAAERGDVRAMVRLGILYGKGDAGAGVDADAAQAWRWFSAAAARDDPEAIRCVGSCYLHAGDRRGRGRGRGGAVVPAGG